MRTGKHSILSITNDSYPLSKIILIFYPYERVKLQIYLQHIQSQFFLWTGIDYKRTLKYYSSPSYRQNDFFVLRENKNDWPK